jgi:hypothetical protein
VVSDITKVFQTAINNLLFYLILVAQDLGMLMRVESRNIVLDSLVTSLLAETKLSLRARRGNPVLCFKRSPWIAARRA